MNRSDERGPWYLFTGLILGAVIGLLYAWAVKPVEYIDTAPASLRKDFKDQYRALIAAAYLGNADLERARARLELLQDADLYRALTEQAQQTLAENGSDRQAQALGLLAIALGQAPPGPAQAVTNPGAITLPASPTRLLTGSPEPPAEDTTAASEAATQSTDSLTASAAITQTRAAQTLSALSSAAPLGLTTPAIPAATRTEAPTPPAPQITPSPSFTPLPSIPAPTPTSSSPFSLLNQEKICDAALGVPEFRIQALDRFNQPVAGMLVIITWPGGENRFYTGLKPEKGLGYADYTPEPGVLYTLKLGENGIPVGNLAAVMCPQSGAAPTWGALLLTFIQS